MFPESTTTQIVFIPRMTDDDSAFLCQSSNILGSISISFVEGNFRQTTLISLMDLGSPGSVAGFQRPVAPAPVKQLSVEYA